MAQFNIYIFPIILKVDLHPVFLKNVNDTASFGPKIRIFRDDTIEIARTGIFIDVDIIDDLNVVTKINTKSWEVGRTLNRVQNYQSLRVRVGMIAFLLHKFFKDI